MLNLCVCLFVILLIAHLKKFSRYQCNGMWVSSCTSFRWIKPELRSLSESDKNLSPSYLGVSPCQTKTLLLAVGNLHKRLREMQYARVACHCTRAGKRDCARRIISFKNSSTLDRALHPRAAPRATHIPPKPSTSARSPCRISLPLFLQLQPGRNMPGRNMPGRVYM
jgi:hypothetical protein